MTTTEKAALYLGIYGALLSTINAVIQVVDHRKDRADIRMNVQKDMVRTDQMNKRYTIITAINRGKRPVRIEGFAARQLDSTLNLLLLDIRPQVPHMLNETESISAWIPNADTPRNVETYFAFDKLGREFPYHMVSWSRRIKSEWKRKRLQKRPESGGDRE